jgi:hypothetical protein
LGFISSRQPQACDRGLVQRKASVLVHIDAAIFKYWQQRVRWGRFAHHARQHRCRGVDVMPAGEVEGDYGTDLTLGLKA